MAIHKKATGRSGKDGPLFSIVQPFVRVIPVACRAKKVMRKRPEISISVRHVS